MCDEVMLHVCDDDYGYEMTIMILFVISKQVSWTKLWTIQWNDELCYIMLCDIVYHKI